MKEYIETGGTNGKNIYRRGANIIEEYCLGMGRATCMYSTMILWNMMISGPKKDLVSLHDFINTDNINTNTGESSDL